MMKALQARGQFLGRSVANREGVVKENPENYLGTDKRGRRHWVRRPRAPKEKPTGTPEAAGPEEQKLAEETALVHQLRAVLHEHGLDIARVPYRGGFSYGVIETLSQFPEDAESTAKKREENLHLLKRCKSRGAVYFSKTWMISHRPEALRNTIGIFGGKDEKALLEPVRAGEPPAPKRPPGPGERDRLPGRGDDGLGPGPDERESGGVHRGAGQAVEGGDHPRTTPPPGPEDESGSETASISYGAADWQELIDVQPPAADEPLAEGVEAGLKDSLQVRDARLIKRAIDTGERAFLLGNGTGTGKTYIAMAAVADQIKTNPSGAPLFAIVPSEKVIKEWQRAGQKFGVRVVVGEPEKGSHADCLYVTSYAKAILGFEKGEKVKGKATWKWTGPLGDRKLGMLILDEVHMQCMKVDDPGARTAQMVKSLQGAAKFILPTTATPFETPLDCAYLWSLGLWGEKGDSDEVLQDRKTFKEWAKQRGMVWFRKEMGKGKGFQEVNARFTGGTARDRARWMLQIRHDLVKNGKGIFREYWNPENPLQYESTMLGLSGDGEFDEVVRTALKALEDVPSFTGIEGSIRKHLVKRLLDYPKLEAAADIAIEQIKAGKAVVVLTQFHSPLDFSKIITEATEEAVTEAGQASLQRELVAQAVKYFSEAFAAAGLQHTVLPGAVDYVAEKIAEVYGPKAVVTMAGPHKGHPQEDFNSGRARAIVATIGAAGTGISLHDLSGDRPRYQINATVPWTGRDLQQMIGRTYREGTASRTTSHFIFVNSPIEREIAKVTAMRVQGLNAGTRGTETSQDYEVLAEYLAGQMVEEAANAFEPEETPRGKKVMAKARLVFFVREVA